MAIDLEALNFGKGGGLVTVVTQDARTGAVLMVAHADRVALERTIETGEMHYRSRSRGLWHKGATSGNIQRVVELFPDCDGDAVLALVEPAGPACHTGHRSCFGSGAFRGDSLGMLNQIVEKRLQEPTGYTGRLLADRNLRLKKVGEEAAELVVACVDQDRARATEEAADLVYHAVVALRAIGVDFDEVRSTLHRRRR